MINISSLTSSQLKRAAEIKEQIEALNQEMASISGDAAPIAVAKAAAPSGATKPARRKISAAGIAKIRAAQKLRWARIKAAAAKPASKGAKTAAKPAKRSKMSAAARAKIAAVARARWAAVRAAGKKRL